MLRALLAKDFARARRNPWPWVIYLLIPLCISGIIGLAFGGGLREQKIGTVRFALVDEDDSIVSRFLRGGMSQNRVGDLAATRLPIEPVLLDRASALARLDESEFSAVIVIPKGFSQRFLTGEKATLELVKNPAESIKPTIIEEALGILTAALDGLARNFSSDLTAWHDALSGHGDLEKIGPLLTEAGRKFRELGPLLNPPLVGYTRPMSAEGDAGGSGGFNLFGHLLLGMVAMFLLFLGGTGMGDLHREIELRTLARYQTLHVSLTPFIAAKVVFTCLMLLLCAAIMFGAGMPTFGIVWHHPLALAALTLPYALFVAGLMAVVAAWIPDQRKADPIRSILSMMLGMAGGCAFPPEIFPPFFRSHVMPWLPTHWYTATTRAVEYGGGTAWWPVALKLALVGAALLAFAAWMLHRRLAKGGRA